MQHVFFPLALLVFSSFVKLVLLFIPCFLFFNFLFNAQAALFLALELLFFPLAFLVFTFIYMSLDFSHPFDVLDDELLFLILCHLLVVKFSVFLFFFSDA